MMGSVLLPMKAAVSGSKDRLGFAVACTNRLLTASGGLQIYYRCGLTTDSHAVQCNRVVEQLSKGLPA